MGTLPIVHSPWSAREARTLAREGFSKEGHAFRAAVLGALRSPACCCLLRTTGFHEFGDPADTQAFVTALTGLLGQVSDDNRGTTGNYVDRVEPTDPDGSDITVGLGECEAHSDESSKLLPEDIVILWCVRQASAGGASRIWASPRLRPHLGDAEATLREPEFLFGGNGRVPGRVVKAPVLYGSDGIRFRLGALRSGHEVCHRPLRPDQEQAVQRLIEAFTKVQPTELLLQPGEALVMLNRRVLHARTSFSDRRRLLLRTRCFNPEMSNSQHDQARWYRSG
ncbi:TauD/TfdA family dioxygenase [Kibdelosporangium persicum]|uniref:TfdA family taurine catabolism dioxygenase TauD n=1 Tax=Kibdelosporangium persicum TaxID=2698649 RepID=A0ABX2FIU3_9PSEU|nr:TauD/TfdA family dioxygenase [Kibdelosporangium persicum]NRN70648.1 TfdA family taurine catabolism dioxygenase TauD [Kibdelosporangium persicum]